MGKGYFNIYMTPCIVVPEGVTQAEKERPVDTEEASGPDMAYKLPNNDNKAKAYLRKAKKY